MKQRVSQLIVCVIAAFITGCAQPCFYQEGKSLEQCRRDLLECLRSAWPELCMRTRGYQYRDAGELPRGRERAKIVAPFGQYWILAGVDTNPENQGVSSAREPRNEDAQTSEGRLVECLVERGDLGTFKVTLVYGNSEQR